MKQYKHRLFFAVIFTLVLLIIGCDKEENPASNGNNNTNGLFKTSGTFSFSSTKGNFVAEGVFDTLMTNTSASGAFKYTEGDQSVLMVMAYNVVSSTNMSLVFAGIIDTNGTVSSGTSYSFAGTSGSKLAVFGYSPNIADTSVNIAFYFLNKGSFNVTTLTEAAIAANFSGSGLNVYDTTKTITLSNGSCNTPIVNSFFDFGMENIVVQKNIETRIKSIMRKELSQLH